MTSTQIVSSVTVVQSSYDACVLDAAKGILEGYTEAYYFFQYNADTWVLIMFDNNHGVPTSTGLLASDCTVVHIGKDTTTNTTTLQYPYSGTLYSDPPGHISGSYNLPYVQTVTHYFITDSYHLDTVAIQNPQGFLVYGSGQNMPKLIEGVQNYAFTGVFICLCIVAFKLFDRIFRRVY